MYTVLNYIRPFEGHLEPAVAPGENEFHSPVLGAHTPRFLALESQTQSCAWLHCHILTSETRLLKASPLQQHTRWNVANDFQARPSSPSAMCSHKANVLPSPACRSGWCLSLRPAHTPPPPPPTCRSDTPHTVGGLCRRIAHPEPVSCYQQ